jgi:hypothetical protein
MTIYLDDQATDIPGNSLADLLQAASTHLEGAGRVVVEVQLNGTVLSGEQLQDRAGDSLADAEVRLYTADPNELAIGALEQSREMLADARRLQDEAASLLQQDQVAKAMQEIAAFIAIWQQVLQALLQSAQLTGLNLDEQEHDGQPLVRQTGDLANRLAMLRDLIGSQDMVSLADVLQYEWPEVCDRWDAIFVDVIGWIRRAA